ncbi:MAG: LysE/ArgO family amino acid transporter [Pseudomonadota bacterium]
MITAALTGFATAFSLILAIGAQNMMVLRQGLARAHIFWVCLFCATSDAILIIAGVLGMGALIEQFPNLITIIKWGAIAFLVFYAGLRLWAAYNGDYEAQITGKAQSLGAVLAAIFAVTWLNPHVYLDTLALIGSISLQYEGLTKTAFAIGAVTSSFVFFFGLGYGARAFAPYFISPRLWRILDISIALVMLLIAFGLLQAL